VRHRHGIPAPDGLFLEKPGDVPRHREFGVGTRRLGEHTEDFPLLPCGEQRERRDFSVRLGRHALQERREVARHAAYPLALEEVAVEFQLAFHGLVGFFHQQAEVELGGGPLQRDGLDMQPGEVGFAHRHVLEHAHHLHQRGMAHVALRLHQFHELFERHVLVAEGVQGAARHAAQHFTERRLAGQIGAQGQGVDEKADQGFLLLARPARRVGAGDDVLAAGIAVDQAVEGGAQPHEEAGVFLLAEGFQPAFQLAVEGEEFHPAPVALRRRTRPVGG